MRIVFFTALKEERAAVRHAWPLGDSGTLMGIPFDSGDRAVLFCTGMGPERMVRSVERGLDLFSPDLAVLLGFSAGLHPNLRAGDVVCDQRGDSALVSALRELSLPIHFGEVAQSELLATVEEKQECARQYPKALAADLETGAFVQAVRAVPHLIFRAISDDVFSELPLPFGELLDPYGFPSEKAILGCLLRRPRLLPKIWKLAQTSAAAQRALRDTLRAVKPLLVARARGVL